jgi:phosphoglucosamine mutase
MSRKYFGTDGVRGKVGVAPMTPDFAMRLGYAIGKTLAAQSADRDNATIPAVLIGKDTRISGYMFESALEAGLSAAGLDAMLVGPMTTPGVAFLTRALRLSAGVMISASHNPYYDNGIKLFSSEGYKLPDSTEQAIEAALDQPMGCNESAQLGKVTRVKDAEGRYLEFCKSSFPKHLNLRGVKLVVDAAHGAGWRIAARLFEELGATVVPIGDRPNGTNINDGYGAVSPTAMAQAVVEHQAHYGIALDGDGDRLIMADHDGTLFDGDQLLYVMVKGAQAANTLRGGAVGTLMTNYALELEFKRINVPFVRAKVGDRYVLEQMLERDWSLGGENSGHLLNLNHHSTGDALISALQVLAALVADPSGARAQKKLVSLAEYTAPLTLYPQVMINIKLAQKIDVANHAALQDAIKACERTLGDTGRVLVRASGTEPVIRVMVEARQREVAQRECEAIAAVLRG